jgi:hypothetical protein
VSKEAASVVYWLACWSLVPNFAGFTWSASGDVLKGLSTISLGRLQCVRQISAGPTERSVKSVNDNPTEGTISLQ